MNTDSRIKNTVPIDIMLPFYGDVDLFKAAVTSVRAQTIREWRLVVVDDLYPSEEPARWLAELADPRIVYVRNEANLGVASNFAKCVTLVEAEWFVMMGGDDLMLPEYLHHVAEVASAHSEADVIQPGVHVIDASGRRSLPLADRIKRMIRPRLPSGEATLRGHTMAKSLARGDWAYFPSMLWRSSTVKSIGFRPDYDIALDLGLLFDIALRNGTMVVTDEDVFAYRRHGDSVSSAEADTGERFRQESRFFAEFADSFDRLGWRDAAARVRRRPIARLHIVASAAALLLRGRLRSSVRLLVEAVR